MSIIVGYFILIVATLVVGIILGEFLRQLAGTNVFLLYFADGEKAIIHGIFSSRQGAQTALDAHGSSQNFHIEEVEVDRFLEEEKK